MSKSKALREFGELSDPVPEELGGELEIIRAIEGALHADLVTEMHAICFWS